MTNQLTSLQTVSKVVKVQVCFEPVLGHRQHPPGRRVLFGSGAGQHAAQGSPGRHPHIGDQAALPGRGPAPLQRPHVPPYVRHQPAQAQTEAARWGRPPPPTMHWGQRRWMSVTRRLLTAANVADWTEVGPASMIVGNLVAGKRIAQACGRDVAQLEDNEQVCGERCHVGFLWFALWNSVWKVLELVWSWNQSELE